MTLEAWYYDKETGQRVEEFETTWNRDTPLDDEELRAAVLSKYGLYSAMIGYTSPDRFTWTRLKESTVLDLFSDGQPNIWYNAERQLYQGYFRTLWRGQRAVGYSETDDFGNWPLPRVVFHAQPQDGLQVDIQEPCYCPYPGRSDLHLLFPHIYDHTAETIDLQLAVSNNGLDWTRPTYDTIVPLSGGNGHTEHSIFASPGLMTLPDGRWGLMYYADFSPHNLEPRNMDIYNHYRWARWQPHRLAAIRAQDHGRFTLRPLPCDSRQLNINFKTAANGYIRVELAERHAGYPPARVSAIPGFEAANCQPLAGDELMGTVSWQGNPDLSPFSGRDLTIRFEMYKASIFAVTV